MEYAVKGETRDGRIVILACGFDSYQDAEDHPVKMSDWNVYGSNSSHPADGGRRMKPADRGRPK